jgi:anti-sigma-K factor RskA
LVIEANRRAATRLENGYPTSMSEHPTESLPAFVLGVLDAGEAIRIADHVRDCPDCRKEISSLLETVALLPYAAEPYQPPERVKRRLMARIMVEQQVASGSVPPFRMRRAQGVWVWPASLLALALVAALSFALLDTRARLNSATAELRQSQAALVATQTEVAVQQQTIAQLNEEKRVALAFIAAPETVGQTLVSQPGGNGPEGKMYMQPGHNRVVLVVHGLRPPPSGKTYQFWFATPEHQVPAETFTVGPDGVAEVVIDAPAPADSFSQVMVTVENAGGSTTPSKEVVLAATLGGEESRG